jgi:hypothetical protein
MAVPDRPDKDDQLLATWGQWVHDETARTIQLRFAHVTLGTDANGYMVIPAATFGLATVVGGVAASAAQGTADTHNVVTEVWAAANGSGLYVRLASLAAAANDIGTYSSLPSTSVNAVAWGTLP